MADLLRNLRIAIVAVVNGDSGAGSLQALMARVPTGTNQTALIHTWQSLKTDGPFPTIAYQLLVFPQNGKNDDTRAGRIRFSIFAQGSGALATCENIAARLETILTHSALLAAVAELDAAPLLVTRLYPNDAEDEDDVTTNPAPSRALERVDVDIDFELTQAA